MRRCIKQQLSIQRVTMIFFIPLCVDLLANILVLVLLPENRFVKHKFWQQRDVNLVRCFSVFNFLPQSHFSNVCTFKYCLIIINVY